MTAENVGTDQPVVCAFCGEDTLTSETEPVDRVSCLLDAAANPRRICLEFLACSERAYRRSLREWAGQP